MNNELIVNGQTITDPDKMKLIAAILGTTLSSEKNIDSVKIEQTDTHKTELNVTVNENDDVEAMYLKYHELIKELIDMEANFDRTPRKMYNIHKLTKELMDIDIKYGWNHVDEKRKMLNQIENSGGNTIMGKIKKFANKARKKMEDLLNPEKSIFGSILNVATTIYVAIKTCAIVAKVVKWAAMAFKVAKLAVA